MKDKIAFDDLEVIEGGYDRPPSGTQADARSAIFLLVFLVNTASPQAGRPLTDRRCTSFVATGTRKSRIPLTDMPIAADSQTERLIALDVPATIGAGTVETSARTIEISETEIFLQSDFLWQEGSWVRVRLRLANDCSAVARGFVYQVDKDVMRLRVLAMGPLFSALLAQERTLPIKLVA